ncbi:hypothetical protein HJC23_013734 [Cyclotella cryptica]|uniref:NADP-dependent oxidoreductase domain-containing protein n=1 Tax=Cyclotella cryptica TaxID=29204 RepID=A0ABD3PH91_9STRA
MRASSLSRLPNLYLGTMTFGWKGQTSSPVDDAIALNMVKSFVNLHNNAAVVRIDTARIYASGDSERMLGSALQTLTEENVVSPPLVISVGTKAHPSQPHGLSPEGLRAQLESSLEAMGVSSVGKYYLHQPDENHPLLDSLKTLTSFVQEGLISSIGLSNYHASEVQRAFDLCNEHGLVKPTVYQGLYNPLNRCVEEELLPVLRRNGCSFVAYNPLAGGMLTGKHIMQDNVQTGRFKNNPNYLPRFYTSANFQAIQLIQSACEAANISMVEATYRWLLCHSALRADDDKVHGDGILIGASSMEQLNENLGSCSRAQETALPKDLTDAFDAAWDVIRREESRPFPYWRSYSADMPNRFELDPGASYSAAKAK